MDNKNDESELTGGNGPPVPIPAAGIGSRIDQAAARIGGVQELASRSGVPASTIYRYRREGGEPTVSALVKLARAAGVSVEWLATGLARSPASVNTVMDDQAEYCSRQIRTLTDMDLLQHVATEVLQEVARLDHQVPPEKVAHTIRVAYQLAHFGETGGPPLTVRDLVALAL